MLRFGLFYFYFISLFLSGLFFAFLVFFSSSFSFYFLGVHIAPLICSWWFWLEVIRDGITSPRWYRSLYVLLLPCALCCTCLLSPIEMHFFYKLFCDHTQECRGVSYCEIIITSSYCTYSYCWSAGMYIYTRCFWQRLYTYRYFFLY